jgi:hypothetical protein
VNVETKEQSKQSIHTHSQNKQAEKVFKQTLSARQKADGNCFLGHKRSADGGINATRDHSDVKIILRNTKILRRTSHSEKSRGMLTFGRLAVFLHENALQHTAADPRTLLKHFNWELFDNLHYSPDVVLSDY